MWISFLPVSAELNVENEKTASVLQGALDVVVCTVEMYQLFGWFYGNGLGFYLPFERGVFDIGILACHRCGWI